MRFTFQQGALRSSRPRSLPGWILWAAGVTFAVVILVPLILLGLAAVLAAAAVFIVLLAVWIVARIISRIVGLILAAVLGGFTPKPPDDGRRNVRVIAPSDQYAEL